jgi:hypothetical protein
MMPSPRPASTRQARAGLEYAIGRVARANPIVAAWRWRYELAAVTGLAVAWLALDTAVVVWLTAGLAVALAITACFPSGRRFLSARTWCVVTPHRVRAGCAQAWIHSRYGKLPIVVLTRRQPFGERVYLWCRAGTSAADFSSARKLLAAACWAQDVQVSQHARYAHLVALDVIRREPPTEWNGHPWYDTGTPSGSLTVPAPREPADDAFWLGEPPTHEEPPRWVRG